MGKNLKGSKRIVSLEKSRNVRIIINASIKKTFHKNLKITIRLVRNTETNKVRDIKANSEI